MPEIYTQDIMVKVLNQIVNQTNVPDLFLATVINSVKRYPDMAHVVNNILFRLIHKEVWNNHYLWKGFIKCCEVFKNCSGIILRLLTETFPPLF